MGLLRPKPKPLSTVRRGRMAEDIIIAKLIACGYTVLIPHGEPTRYDLVIEDADGNFWRVQCKLARLHRSKTALEYMMYSFHQGYKEPKLYDSSIHYFAVYSSDLNKVYLVPHDNPNQKQGYLRLADYQRTDHTGSKHFANDARLAEDYEI